MNMTITKSKFMEYKRCQRFPALNELYKRKDLDDAAKDKFHDLLDTLDHVEDFIEEDFTSPDLEHLEVMMPYFNEIEVLNARKVMTHFGGETKYGTTYGSQKLFIRDYHYFNLNCYVDIYNRNEEATHIVEVKATTTNKFMSLKYTENKVEYFLFSRDEDNILHLNEEYDPSLLENEKYLAQRNKLFDSYHSAGAYVYDLAFQRFIIEEDIQDAKYYLGVVNHEYVFDGTYVDGKPIYDQAIAALIDVTKITKELQPIIQKELDVVIERINKDDLSRVELGRYCQVKKMRECIFKDLCYDKLPKKNNIMMYMDRHHGFKDEATGDKYALFDLINDGYTSMVDVPHSWLNRRNNQIQRDVAISHKPYIDYAKIRSAIETIKYPIYHLDFESFPCPLPRFRGETAYTQSLFQFSLHIEVEPGVCDKERDHIEFLAEDEYDNREKLVEKLCASIKQDGGSIMVYNQAFEKTRIKELAVLFPEYKEQLLEMNERLFDLMHIVKTNTSLFVDLGFDQERAKTINYYHEDLLGSFSIKKVLPLFSDLSYQGMPVGNGMEAVYAYARYKDLSKAELEITRRNLREYCKQDTWAMVEILEQLRKI
ncbi:MAG: DUF2779 domain-containing protein [Candidatus Izemoplasmataceae bacterium]